MYTELLIDADPIVYRCGFASERTEYEVVYDDGESVKEITFAPSDGEYAGNKKKAWIAAHVDCEILSEDRRVYPEPLGHAIQAVRTQLDSIFAACGGDRAKSRLYLTGTGNFRDKIATLKPYKGNRDPEHKPYHYKAIREYLLADFSTRLVDGMEADDAISIDSYSLDSRVIVTIDKDLDQIPGEHYDYLKQTAYQVSPESATKWFWTQVLAGDPTDNIGGCWRISTVKAEKAIQQAYDDGRHPWEEILWQYATSLTRPGCPYADKDAIAVAIENARLVYLLKKEGEIWNPPPIL